MASPTLSAEALLTFNGIDATSGEYLLPPMTAGELAGMACGVRTDPEHLAELRWRRQQEQQAHYAVKEGVDPKKLSETGWGVIFAYDADPAIREVMAPLLDHRRALAAAGKEHYYREFTGAAAYRPNESKQDFLARHGAGPGAADPENVPYYLLIVGDPETIPFSFQYQLDVQYAVGRICFDTVEEYARYARSVVEAERGGLALARRAAFFGVANADDAATQMSADDLTEPLAQWATSDQTAWKIESYVRERATKAQLASLLGGGGSPALLFTASHGMGFPNGDRRQLPHQGAILCQDWPGPREWRKPVPQEFYFAGDDLSSEASVFGLIAMHFACYAGGVPRLDQFAQGGQQTRAEIAPRAFVSRLPQRLLSHPRGGALAVIAHVERSWGYSFRWERAGRQLQVFESTLKRLMEGHPAGSALEYFNSRYAELSSDLASELEEVKYGKVVNPLALSGMWTANNDARSYTVMGDPAVRLMTTDDAGEEKRPVMSTINISAAATAPAPQQPQPSAAQLDYGLLDTLREGQRTLAASLEQMLTKFGATLEKAFDSITTVQVATYAAERMEDVKYENGQFTGARLRALTRAGLDGNTLVCVPEQDGKVDDELWKLHSEIVSKAMANRTEMIKLAATAASSLLGGLKLT